MTQPNAQNFVLTQPMHFESGPFDGKAGDVCVWRHPGQLVIYRASELVANFPMTYVSVQALKSDKIFSLGTRTPKGVDLNHVPSLGAGVPSKPIVRLPHVDVTETVVSLPPVTSPVIEDVQEEPTGEVEAPEGETEEARAETEAPESETEAPKVEAEEPTGEVEAPESGTEEVPTETEAPQAETPAAPKATRKPAARKPAAKKAK